MFVVIFKQHGALNSEQEVFGPFDCYVDAEDALVNSSVPLLYGQGGRKWPDHEMAAEAREGASDGYRYIQELTWVNGCVL
jgi:hypothetical protein